MREPVLVASVDGVGTKLKIAFAMNKHDTVGVDLVNHCVNDIAVLGARPLFFLDYIGCERLEPRVFQQLLRGLSRACRAAGCALIGGETAQMPGMYRKGEYDLAGCIVGVVDRRKSSMAATSNPATSFSVCLRMVCTPMATRWREKFCSRKCGSNRVRLYPVRQSLSAKNCCACTKIISRSWQKFRWHDQRPRSYHRWRSHRQSASNFAVEL
jgi:hypothetical protein